MELSTGVIDKKIEELKTNCDYIEDTLTHIVTSYTSSLDELMKAIQDDIVNIDDCPISIIERYFIELSSAIYFIGSKVEKLGIYDGVSKLSLKEKFNNCFIDNSTLDEKGKKKTAAEITAISEQGSTYESAVSDLYNRAYKIVKFKVDAAQTMCSTLSKVLSHRMQNEINASTAEVASTRQILNENLR